MKLDKVALANNWQLIYPCEYRNILSRPCALLEKFTHCKFPAFYCHIYIHTVAFLVGIFSKEKEIRLYSPHLSQELCLPPECDELAEHIERINQLPHYVFPGNQRLITQLYGLPEISVDSIQVDDEVKKLRLHMQRHRRSPLQVISDFILTQMAQYHSFRIHLLKFVMVLPSVERSGPGEIARCLRECLSRLLKSKLPWWWTPVAYIAYFLAHILPAFILAPLARFTVAVGARRFIAGENMQRAQISLRRLFASERDATLDQLGELVVCEREADAYQDKIIGLIDALGKQIPAGKRNRAGINCAHISIKVSALCSDFRSYTFAYNYHRIAPRLRKILCHAHRAQVFINIDAEQYKYRDMVFGIYAKVLTTCRELEDYSDTGVVLQSYLRDAAEHLQEILQLAKQRSLCMPVRLVKGAYWDIETIDADAHGYTAPVFLDKGETDLHFHQLMVKILDCYPHLQLTVGGHNILDHAVAEVLRRERYPKLPPIEHQCLHMTCESLSMGMKKSGWVVRNYVPIGPLIVGMAYLVRRIMENSSQVGVLAMINSRKNNVPSFSSIAHDYHNRVAAGILRRDVCELNFRNNFFNVAPVRLEDRRQLELLQQEMSNFTGDIDGDFAKTSLSGDKQKVYSPNDPRQQIGQITFATKEDALDAIERADRAYVDGDWPAASSKDYRIRTMLRAARLLLARRNELAVLMMHEGGKAIAEALGDVDEAIDFINFYARMELQQNNLSRGTVAVISPWNFPLAIPCGMVAAALVAGNCVILKSARHTPLIAAHMVDIFHQAGVPTEVLCHLPGKGGTVGEQLVQHPLVAALVFTGSQSVGVSIVNQARRRIYRNRRHQQSYPVRTIAEMGGKNAIIVTASAELDETIDGILYSTFGHAGQKCSAASRIIVDSRVRVRLLERLIPAIADLQVGRSDALECFINPLISTQEKERLRKEIAEAVQEAQQHGGCVHIDRSEEKFPGNCLGPCLIELPWQRALHNKSFAGRELFGPVLHMIGFDNFDQALAVYNGTDYALTGGVFSQSQDDIDFLIGKMQSGNIYVNRSITGARVGIEPFGGFKFSGTGPKAGGVDYVDAFHLRELATGNFYTCEGPFPDYNLSPPTYRQIPGQQSYYNYSLLRSPLLIIRESDTLSPAAQRYANAAYSMGRQVKVTGKNHDLGQLVNDPTYGTIMVDGSSKLLQEVQAQLQAFKAVCTPETTSLQRIVRAQFEERSFAINTVRHGAPMDLS